MRIGIVLPLALAAAVFGQTDMPGVAVRSPHEFLHRSGVEYPPESASKGVVGEVVVAVFVNPSGEVYDARISSGPNELRRAVIQSALGWHFDPESQLPQSFEVSVLFDAPTTKTSTSSDRIGDFSSVGKTMVAKQIDFSALPERLHARVARRLPAKEGDSISPDAFQASIREIDRHIQVGFLPAQDGTVNVRMTLQGAPPPPAPDRIRVGGNVQAANLIKQVPPVYPPLARQAMIQGTVRLSIVINRDGTIQNVQLVSGHPLLVPASVAAVKQWIYKPTLVNGRPVEVITQVDVSFVISD